MLHPSPGSPCICHSSVKYCGVATRCNGSIGRPCQANIPVLLIIIFPNSAELVGKTLALTDFTILTVLPVNGCCFSGNRVKSAGGYGRYNV